MSGYLIKRLIGVVTNLILVSILVFGLLRVVPGDPTFSVLGENASPEARDQFRESRGLNGSITTQYLDWAKGVLQGDFGTSLRANRDITDEFFARIPLTLEIVFLSFTMTATIGIIGGVASAATQGKWLDNSLRLVAIIGLAVPSFVWLTLLLVLPARFWGYAPPFGSTSFFDSPFANLQLFLPPAMLLAIGGSAGLMRLTRTAFLDVLRQDYMRTATAKGLSKQAVYYRHGLRNAMAPVLTLAGLQLGNLLGGSVILESIMGIPGIGRWTLEAITFRDYPVIMTTVLWSAILLMSINLIVDIATAALDPRIKYR